MVESARRGSIKGKACPLRQLLRRRQQRPGARGLGVIFITHNVHHAYPVGDAFTILNRGRTYGTFQKADVSREEVLNMMAGGKELDELSAELEEFSRTDAATATPAAAAEHAIAQELHREAEALHKH
jgi:ABC-type sugar transport system ATPase subunit